MTDIEALRRILGETRVIAVVGLSANWWRPSYFAAKYLLLKGYDIIPINPKEKGNSILGKTVLSSLDDLNNRPDMIDIFRMWKDKLISHPSAIMRARRKVQEEETQDLGSLLSE